MDKISDYFVGQTQDTIDNIKGYIKIYPLCILGFSFVKSSIINYLKTIYDSIELYTEITDRNSYYYINIDSDYKYSIYAILDSINNYILVNKFDKFIEVSKVINKDSLVLRIKVE